MRRLEMSRIDTHSTPEQPDLIDKVCNSVQLWNIKMWLTIFFICWTIVCKSPLETVNSENGLFHVLQSLIIVSCVLSDENKVDYSPSVLQCWVAAKQRSDSRY